MEEFRVIMETESIKANENPPGPHIHQTRAVPPSDTPALLLFGFNFEMGFHHVAQPDLEFTI